MAVTVHPGGAQSFGKSASEKGIVLLMSLGSKIFPVQVINLGVEEKKATVESP